MTKDELDELIEKRLATRKIEVTNQLGARPSDQSYRRMQLLLDTYRLGMLDLRDAILAAKCPSISPSGEFSCQLPREHQRSLHEHTFEGTDNILSWNN